jgi:hypothetical protein
MVGHCFNSIRAPHALDQPLVTIAGSAASFAIVSGMCLMVAGLLLDADNQFLRFLRWLS